MNRHTRDLWLAALTALCTAALALAAASAVLLGPASNPYGANAAAARLVPAGPGAAPVPRPPLIPSA